MGLIRKDHLLEQYVYFAAKRGIRPHEFVKSGKAKKGKIDFFAPGNEKLTPPEIGRVEHKDGWLIRWFENKFAAVEHKGKPGFKGPKHFREGRNFGYHEIIVEDPAIKTQLADVPVEQLTALLKVYAVRIKELSKRKGIKYVQVFKNHGSDAGTSLIHEHSQVVAIPHVPPTVAEKLKAIKGQKDPYAAIIRKEMTSQRRIAANKSFVAFCPFASRFSFEAWIMPKRPLRNFSEFEEEDFSELAKMLKRLLLRLKSINASYNYHVHYTPDKEDLRFCLQITPRTATWAGFEMGSGCIINSVMPEDAAKFYREKD